VPSFPYVPGREGSGVIAATAPSGELYGLQVGDRVAYMAEATYAQYTAAPASKTVRVPDGVSMQDAAAALLQALTAWTLLLESHPLKADEWALVHAAAGGVGQWVVQLAKKHIGAKVIALVSTPKIDLAKSYGADVVVDYTKEDYVQRVKEITNGEGVHVVYDSVGKDTFDRSLECVRRKGTMVTYGNATGAIAPFQVA
jgi:NADPH2:quinone reductase